MTYAVIKSDYPGDMYPWIVRKDNEDSPFALYRTKEEAEKCVKNQLVAEADAVNHPKHYTSHPSGVECIQVTEHMNFNKGNAFKYLWRSEEKGNEIQDLEKARWYINREIARLKRMG